MIDWFDLLAVQGTLESLLRHHSLETSIFQWSAFFLVQLLHPYMTTRKTTALTKWTFIGKVMSLLFNILYRLVIGFLPRDLLDQEISILKRWKYQTILPASWEIYRQIKKQQLELDME